MTACIDNSQNPLIIDSGAHFSIVARNYLENHFPHWDNQLFLTKAKNFKSASRKMTSIGTIIREIIIPHRKGNIRLNPEFVVLDDAHIQGFLLGTDYQRMYGIDIYNIKNRHITIGTNREKKFSLDIYQISSQDPPEELLNGSRDGQVSTTLTSKQKLSLLKMLRKNRPAFAIGEEPLGNIRGHDIELYLDVQRPYPSILSRPPYPASLGSRKEIEKHINELLDMDVVRKIGHNEIVEITTPVPITWHYGKSWLCGDFRALNNYTKDDRYPIPRIPHALDKLTKARDITKMDSTIETTSKTFAHITSSLYKLFSKDEVFEITKERRDAYERIKYELTNAPVLILPDFELPLKLYIQEQCSQGLGAALYQRKIVDGEPREGVIWYICRQLKHSEDRYGATQTKCLCLVWALEKLHYYLEVAVFEVYTECTALKSLLSMKTTNRHMLRWQITIQEYRGNTTIIYKEGKIHTNADGLSRWPVDNVKGNPAYDPEEAAKLPIHVMEIDRKKNFRFSEWAPESGTPRSGNTNSEGTETPILGISSSELHTEFFNAVMKTNAKHKQCGILL
ncbi:hypothetical protein O181_051891 [Austropuccinia psidii MF-1]|uniref:Reverse transcriptase RNase H-like domain-containing protein n=1 Tax=Austropuccinia psidii MF-1 TaxID=1389203 RepID=A0A9Q3DXA9_9BASI|nr:hypothetical protein [Austropuccinia psidii MF-1]